MNSNSSIPDWMKKEENYIPKNDRDGFIVKSAMKMMGVLQSAREEGSIGKKQTGAPFKLFMTVYLILLTGLAKNLVFVLFVLAGVLARCALLPGKQLGKVLKVSVGVTLITAVFLIPSVYLGSPHTLISVSSRVLISTSLVGILNSTTPWNKITEGLGAFHVPDLMILTLDLTIKYIVILGDLCVATLEALKLRSVGKNRAKRDAMSGVLGVTFLRSRELSEETYQAMVCRGFEGEYRKKRSGFLCKDDLIRILIVLLATALFLYLEILI